MLSLLDRWCGHRTELAMLGRLIVALLLLSVLAIFLTSCGLLGPRIGPELAEGVTRYCKLPEIDRLLVRESINTQIAPHRVELVCAQVPAPAQPPVPSAPAQPAAAVPPPGRPQEVIDV